MGKLYEFELVVRGYTKDHPPDVIVKYFVARSPDELGGQHVRNLDIGDLNKIIFHEGTEGELWPDIFSEIETLEDVVEE